MTIPVRSLSFRALNIFRHFLILLGCIHVAIGPMNALQLVAWTGMLWDYSQQNNVAEAVEMTFDGDHPCELCLAIADAKKNSEEQPLSPAHPDSREQQRLDLFPLPTVQTQAASRQLSSTGPPAGPIPQLLSTLALEVPSPPPRA